MQAMIAHGAFSFFLNSYVWDYGMTGEVEGSIPLDARTAAQHVEVSQANMTGLLSMQATDTVHLKAQEANQVSMPSGLVMGASVLEYSELRQTARAILDHKNWG